MRKYAVILTILTCLLIIPKSTAWSNGGYSADPEHPDYGTHDWIAEHALDYLPDEEKAWINMSAYLLGTELPDNSNHTIGGIGDTAKHHVYYYSNGTLQDNASAVRAQEEYDLALSYLEAGDYRNASIRAGVMSHYIADVAVWCHVMGASTDWGAESNHSNYENYVTGKMKNYTSTTFDPYLKTDNTIFDISAYNATLTLAKFTTFGIDLTKNCTWMNTHYNWSDTHFKDSCGYSLSLAVFTVANVLHTLAVESGINVTEGGVVVVVCVFTVFAIFLWRKKTTGAT